jgi:3-hydroxyisobutyrate dehydrogenase
MNIGVLGLGRMGSAMAERLLDLGHTLTVWNRTPDKAEGLVQRGAKLAASPAAVVADAQVVLSVLTDAAAIDAAYLGPNGALTGQARGRLFIDLSTVRPETSIQLAAHVQAAHAALLECPVGGTVGPARQGQLFGFVGGDAGDFARAKPLLDQLCRRVEHVGAIGAGASVKLAANLPLLVYWQALAEALLMAQPSGLPPERLLDILCDTPGAPAIMKFRGSAVVAALNGVDQGPAHFNIDAIRKDLRAMVSEAQAMGRDLPAATATLRVFDQASASGLGQGDGTELAAWWLNDASQP